MKERLFIPFDEAEKLFSGAGAGPLVDIDDFRSSWGKAHGFICRARSGQVVRTGNFARICRALQVVICASSTCMKQLRAAGRRIEKTCEYAGVLPDEEREQYEAPFLSASGCRTIVTAGFVQIRSTASLDSYQMFESPESIVTTGKRKGEETLCVGE